MDMDLLCLYTDFVLLCHLRSLERSLREIKQANPITHTNGWVMSDDAVGCLDLIDMLQYLTSREINQFILSLHVPAV